MITKINIIEIVSDHLKTLSDQSTGKILISDLILFYGMPIAIAISVGLFLELKNEDHIEAIISIYAIFSALLMSAQVALYSIFRSWNVQRGSAVAPSKNEAIRRDADDKRVKLAKQVNVNLSYLIVLSTFALVLCIIFSVTGATRSLEDSITLGLTTHFVLTLLMVVKRMHILFDAEYC